MDRLLFEPEPRAGQGEMIIAWCDGGSRGNPGPAGYGVRIEDGHGGVLGELSEFVGIKTNNFAEYQGMLAALQFAIDHGHPRLKVIADSELMVKQMKGQYRVNSPDLKPLWEEAKRRVAKLELFRIEHTLRGGNKHADRLANEAMDRGMRRRPAPPSGGGETPARGERFGAAPAPVRSEKPAPLQEAGRPRGPQMLRGFVKDGVVHLLGGTIADGKFVKVLAED